MSHYVTIRFDFSDTSKYASIPLYIGFPATFIPFFIYIQSELSPLQKSLIFGVFLQFTFLLRTPSGIRTLDPLIKSQLLYQLS